MSVFTTKDFIGKPAPPNYVAGLGRGATGVSFNDYSRLSFFQFGLF
jgi:hypothetical protein